MSYSVRKTQTRVQKLTLGYLEWPECVRYVSHLHMKDMAVLCEASYTNPPSLGEPLLGKSDLWHQFEHPTHFKEDEWFYLIMSSDCHGLVTMNYSHRGSDSGLPSLPGIQEVITFLLAVLARITLLLSSKLSESIYSRKQDCRTEIRFWKQSMSHRNCVLDMKCSADTYSRTLSTCKNLS